MIERKRKKIKIESTTLTCRIGMLYLRRAGGDWKKQGEKIGREVDGERALHREAKRARIRDAYLALNVAYPVFTCDAR